MEVDLENFLIARAVAQDKINHMKTDKRHTPNRVTLLERIREKIGNRKMLKTDCHTPSESHGLSRKCNKSGEKVVRKIEIGWLHYSKPHYTQVRTRHGGGTRHTTVPKETTVEQVLETGKRLFFPNGSSTKGPQHIFDFEVRDFKRNYIPLEETVGKLYESTKLKLLRFYICSKDKFSVEDEIDSSTEDLEDLSTGSREQQPNAPAHASPDSSVQSIAAISGPTEGFRRASIQSRELLPTAPAHVSPDSVQASTASYGATEGFRRASIRRINVVEDVLSVFMDSSIISLFLKMDFVNENAVADSGVSREVYTAFWEMFL
ncbi:uncharacterized protein LOC130386499 [Gadus chalcogrammus]|uniref:uncharacterized protein LOC130386499 n=1 Tax=Gadus chalcogrammus TaxID=1042646 RepID=UPI0024C498D7|nr:uncharacterized protein LOC130386499 [Gadus chalcogrammus]